MILGRGAWDILKGRSLESQSLTDKVGLSPSNLNSSRKEHDREVSR